MIDIQNIYFGYTKNSPAILSNFSFKAYPGEIVHIKGASGSGKTTLLYLLCGVIPKNINGDFSGKVSINEQNIESLSLPQISPLASLLMQEPEVQLFFPTVEQELAFGPENLLVEPDEIHRRINETLHLLDIKHMQNSETSTLSFGEKKLVALASLVTLDPQVFLLDEPLAGISPIQVANINNIIRILAEKGKIIFITEHMNELLDSPHRTIDLEQL